MPFAVCLSVNNKSMEFVHPLWETVSQLEHSSSMLSLNYLPHITLVVCDHIDTNALSLTIKHIIKELPTFNIQFSRIRYFDANPNTPLVLWLAPDTGPHTKKLFELQSKVQAKIDPTTCHHHYRSDNWVPHCSLGTDITPANNPLARNFANDYKKSIDIRFDVVDIVEFKPVKVIQRFALGG